MVLEQWQIINKTPPKFFKKIKEFFFFLGIILNDLKIFKRTLLFWPPIPDNIHIYLRKSKNKHKFYLNRRIILEIQTILQKYYKLSMW